MWWLNIMSVISLIFMQISILVNMARVINGTDMNFDEREARVYGFLAFIGSVFVAITLIIAWVK